MLLEARFRTLNQFPSRTFRHGSRTLGVCTSAQSITPNLSVKRCPEKITNRLVLAAARRMISGGAIMVIGDRLKALREQKKMSQGDIEKRTGLLRVYISRIENGHTVPAIETLEKMATALEIPMYQLFYDGENPPAPQLPRAKDGWGISGRDARTFDRFRRLFSRARESDRKLLLMMAQKMAANRERARKRNQKG
jgi:transcriptional regulator with XRE-family HTH domain